MILGMDCSLEVCKHEGYTVIEYKHSELMKAGKVQVDAYINVYQYVPAYNLGCEGVIISGSRCYYEGKCIQWPKLIDESISVAKIKELASLDSVTSPQDVLMAIDDLVFTGKISGEVYSIESLLK